MCFGDLTLLTGQVTEGRLTDKIPVPTVPENMLTNRANGTTSQSRFTWKMPVKTEVVVVVVFSITYFKLAMMGGIPMWGRLHLCYWHHRSNIIQWSHDVGWVVCLKFQWLTYRRISMSSLIVMMSRFFHTSTTSHGKLHCIDSVSVKPSPLLDFQILVFLT